MATETEARRLKRVVVKEELVKLTCDRLAAEILDQMLYWSERTYDFDRFIEEEKQRDPESNMPLTHGWIYKSARELREELMLDASARTVNRRLEELVAKGWLDRRRNPRHQWDKTWQYRPNIHKIQSDLADLGYALEGYPLQLHSVASKGHGVASKGHGVAAIPETTIETTTENDSSSSNEEEASPYKPLLRRFNELMTLLEGGISNKEKNAAVTRFYVALFGCEAGKRPPYSRVGKLCKKYGHARVAQVLWDVVSKSPRGDPLSYAQTVLKGNKRNGRGADSQGKDDWRTRYYEADPNDPDIKAWLEERRKHGTNDQSGGSQENTAGLPASVPASAGAAGTPAQVVG